MMQHLGLREEDLEDVKGFRGRRLFHLLVLQEYKNSERSSTRHEDKIFGKQFSYVPVLKVICIRSSSPV
jgi:hypothetical protein